MEVLHTAFVKFIFCCGQILKSMCYSYKFAEITELYVMDEYRRQGIGRLLLDATEKELYKRGVKDLHVLTGDKNFIAQTLYRSCGYGDTSEILLDKNMEG
jgi:ribosomal protein S18 acetylase RimI-like enzyme